MMTMLTTPVRPPSLAVLLPAAIAGFSPPRTEAEARAFRRTANAAERRKRDEQAREHQRREQYHAEITRENRRLSAWRPPTRSTAKTTPTRPSITTTAAIPRARNNGVAPAQVITQRRLNVTAIYAEMNRRHDAVRGYVRRPQ